MAIYTNFLFENGIFGCYYVYKVIRLLNDNEIKFSGG